MQTAVALVLVVEDDELQRLGMLRLIRSFGFDAEGAADGPSALTMVETRDIAVAVLDFDLGEANGIDTLERIRELRPNVECVLVTGVGGGAVSLEARARGASDYFEKPIVDVARFRQVIRRACEVSQLRRSLSRQAVAAPVSSIVGASDAIERVRALVERMAASSAPVLITGESGVGKEVVAESLHDRSRARGQFVRVNCAAVPESLIEAELFGAVEGTFTGQKGRRDGLLAAADHGTLLLDEIGDMPLDLQPTLLRALENRTFRPLGARVEQPLTARVVAATNVNLREAVAAGKFREDLYFRLAVLTIDVPPLRDHLEDIPLLLKFFLKKYATAEGRQPLTVPDAVIAALLQHRWPGNVRELANAAYRAVVLSVGTSVQLDDFGLRTESSDEQGTAPPDAPFPFEACLDLPLADAKARVVDTFVSEYLRHKLRQANGNVTQAAQMAGMLRPNFRREMRRYGVESSED